MIKLFSLIGDGRLPQPVSRPKRHRQRHRISRCCDTTISQKCLLRLETNKFSSAYTNGLFILKERAARGPRRHPSRRENLCGKRRIARSRKTTPEAKGCVLYAGKSHSQAQNQNSPRSSRQPLIIPAVDHEMPGLFAAADHVETPV